MGERAEIVPIPRLHYHIHPKKPQPAGYGWRFRFTIAKNPFGPAAKPELYDYPAQKRCLQTAANVQKRRVRSHVPPPRFLDFLLLVVNTLWVHVQFIIGLKSGYARRVSSRFRQSDSGYSAAGDLGLHHGLDGLFALACDANGELIERGHHGVMATEQTCQ